MRRRTFKFDELRLVCADVPYHCACRIACSVCCIIDTKRRQDIMRGCISDVSQEHLTVSLHVSKNTRYSPDSTIDARALSTRRVSKVKRDESAEHEVVRISTWSVNSCSVHSLKDLPPPETSATPCLLPRPPSAS